MKNDYTIQEDGSIKIELTQGQYTLIDAADLELVQKLNWFTRRDLGYKSRNRYYAVHKTNYKKPCGKWSSKLLYLHNYLLSPVQGQVTDHIAGEGLNNRRANLRTCSRLENSRNQQIRSTNTSGFKGVSFDKNTGKYRAYIRVAGKLIHLGSFTTALSASQEYDAAAVQYFGEFASTNAKLIKV